MNRVEFVVYGTPAPQGSKRHVGGGRMIESSKKLKPWRESVKWAALETRGRNDRVTFDGPLIVSMVFTLPKPASAPKTRRTWPDRKPDIDKLCRSTLDAIVESGLAADDARFIHMTAAKLFPGEGQGSLDTPGVRILIERMT